MYISAILILLNCYTSHSSALNYSCCFLACLTILSVLFYGQRLPFSLSETSPMSASADLLDISLTFTSKLPMCIGHSQGVKTKTCDTGQRHPNHKDDHLYYHSNCKALLHLSPHHPLLPITYPISKLGRLPRRTFAKAF